MLKKEGACKLHINSYSFLFEQREKKGKRNQGDE